MKFTLAICEHFTKQLKENSKTYFMTYSKSLT